MRWSEEVKQFAIKYAYCLKDLDHSYFKETLLRQKTSDLLAKAKFTEALSLICEE